ncbi:MULTISPECIES: hypothetical protein [unclassified Bacillus cereus group]|uniref:hypothetical protein n=1 Tax=unclassified Bacillus cereus group TaxID=2750818 RepID=UPI001F5A2AED|nr:MULTISPECIES: hypothetical protein [unclassified Bacillus cereus group]
MSFEWYNVVSQDTDIAQGDILMGCRIPFFESTDAPPFFQVRAPKQDVIIMTQACDLANQKIDYVTVCPLMSMSHTIQQLMLNEYEEGSDARKGFDYTKLTGKQKKRKQSIIQSLKSGHYLDLHVLNHYVNEKTPELNMEYKIVQLKQAYIVPIKTLKQMMSKMEKTSRLSLLPPYREHLAQAYARTFGRIGLPIDLCINDSEV